MRNIIDNIIAPAHFITLQVGAFGLIALEFVANVGQIKAVGNLESFIMAVAFLVLTTAPVFIYFDVRIVRMWIRLYQKEKDDTMFE